MNLTSSAGRQTWTTSSAAAPSSTWNSGASQTSGASAATTTGQPSSSSSSYQQMSWTPAYPRVLKIEERRIPRGDQSISPYCKFYNPPSMISPTNTNYRRSALHQPRRLRGAIHEQHRPARRHLPQRIRAIRHLPNLWQTVVSRFPPRRQRSGPRSRN